MRRRSIPLVVLGASIVVCCGLLLVGQSALAGDCEQDGKQYKPVNIGRVMNLHSELMDLDRKIYVHLPKGYQISTQSYPVLYLLDGPAHFFHAVGNLSYLSFQGRMPQLIIVGISHEKRANDMLPAKDADLFLQSLREEIIPFVEDDLRTHPYRILMGHSYGGQFAFHALMSDPSLFQAYLAVSPTLAWKDAGMAEFEAAFAPRLEGFLRESGSLDRFLYITRADEEGNSRKSLQTAVKLLKKYAPDDLAWSIHDMPGEDHGTTVPSSLQGGLRALYEGWNASKLVKTGDMLGLEAHYAALAKRFGYEIPIPEYAVNLVGYALLGREAFDEAIAIFRTNVELHPDSANVYDSLGEGLEKSGDLDEARQSYEKAVKLGTDKEDPNLPIYRKNLQRVQAELGLK